GESLMQDLRLLAPLAAGVGQGLLAYVPAGAGGLSWLVAQEASANTDGDGASTARARAPATRRVPALSGQQQLHAGPGRRPARVQALALAAEDPPARARYPHLAWPAAQISDPALLGRIVLVDPRGLPLLRYAVEPGAAQAQRVAGEIRSD